MSKKHKQNKVPNNKQPIARITKKRLTVLITILLAVLAFFIFEPRAEFWPAWLIDIRGAFITIVGFLTVFLILMSPIIIVTESDPRPLSGSEKTPWTGLK